MNNKEPTPGIYRDERISDDGLVRLKNQLEKGVNISRPVLEQWIKRYGEQARNIIVEYRKDF